MKSREIALNISSVTKEFNLKKDNFFKKFFEKRNHTKSNSTKLSKKDYKYKKTILKDINFKVFKGDIVGIIGQNGSGKSTLLSIIAGIIEPNKGSVIKNGRCLALLELGSGFNLEFTGRENIFLNGLLFGSTKLEVTKKLNDIVKFSELGNYIDNPIKQYSSGMIVRLAFSIMAHLEADILIIDEALAVGDISFQKKCFSFLENFQKNNGTILFVSHSLEQIKKLCNNIIYLKETEIVTGQVKEICDLYEKDQLNKEDLLDNDFNSIVSKKIKTSLLIPKKFIFPSFSNHYGNFKIKISAAWLTNEKNNFITQSIAYEKLSWNFVAVAHEKMNNIHFGFSIRTKEGITILSTNTLQQNKKPFSFKKDTEILISFNFINYLGYGDFFFNSSIFRGTTDNPEYIHRIVDAQVLSNKLKNNSSFGILGIEVASEVIKNEKN